MGDGDSAPRAFGFSDLSVGWMAEGMYATALHDLAAGQLSGFLGLYVLTPSLAGIAFRKAVGE